MRRRARSTTARPFNGERYTGIQKPDQLAELSDYEGKTNFKYMMPGL
ncbi:MAG: hypothetical protein F6K03_03040 [Kamptonema sp. SIO4C4]|nr:hypothetical protein [Kamptonema sp. SIO4C4]